MSQSISRKNDVRKKSGKIVLEIMKMETPVVASSDGVIASIEVSKGQNVEAGAVLATMNE